MPFTVTDRDREFFETRLKDFLPPKIVDIHAHVWKREFRIESPGAPVRAVSWPALVAADDPIEDLAATYELMFPGKQTGALIFGFPSMEWDIDASNRYVAEVGQPPYYPLALSLPTWSAEQLVECLNQGSFLGTKVYLNFADPSIASDDIRIFDFAPHHQLQVLNDRGAILMLHIPRSGRLRDPQNIADLKELHEKYPKLQVIVAHVGRAYCDADLGDAFAQLAECDRLLFDFCANTNAHVFAEAIRAVGPSRLLFGSDLPITRMRMRRICEGELYVNIVPPGLYGDVAGDPNMRETTFEDAERLTFFMYEEIDAFRRASEECGLTPSDIEQVFYSNAMRVIGNAAQFYQR